jgi:peptidoglycan/xylan/chitin deacetylase (PgdA/CDA1 family)
MGPLMRFGPTARVGAILVVIVSAIIGSSYALGRATGGSGGSDRPAAGRPAATAPADPSPPTGSPSASPGPAAAAGGPAPAQQARPVLAVQQASLVLSNPIVGPGMPPLKPERRGPYGARMSTGTPQVALSFDDGPDPTYTPQTLAQLRRYRVKATFCLVGENARAFPDLVRAIAADGHTLCNHSWAHDTGLGLRSRAAIRADLKATNAAIRAAVPTAKVSYFRQPGGMWTAGVVAVAKELGMSSLHWEVDPQDWRKPGAGSISSTVNAGTRRGAIVLLHDAGGDRRGTVAALRSILPNLTRRFQLVALPPGVDPPRFYGRDLPLHPGQQ